MFDYVRDPAEIYRRSFAAIEAAADLSRFKGAERAMAVRLIHACGMAEIAADLVLSGDPAQAGKAALAAGAPILVDAEMVARGVIAHRLPANNRIICTLNDDGVRERAAALGTTRSAAAVDAWVPHLAGAVVAIGNAPTALFRLLELLAEGAPKPAVILGFPVGFIGAAESKQVLIDHAGDIPFTTLPGQKGGSALAAAAVNALCPAPEQPEAQNG
ncbi:precorrin-8X methylmutase [bacterium SCSIO 12827]|nr:precorrin-8X methylmutase [bacterium SCSIO 12827]